MRMAKLSIARGYLLLQVCNWGWICVCFTE